MLIEAGEDCTIFIDRLIIAARTGESVGEALAAGDVADQARLVLITSQILVRIEHLAYASHCAARAATGKQAGQQLDQHVRDRPGEG